MMDGIGYEGIVIDGCRICFEYRFGFFVDVIVIMYIVGCNLFDVIGI